MIGIPPLFLASAVASAAPATPATLADLQTIIADFSDGIGFLRDFRMPDGMYTDAGTLTANDGDLVYRFYNQSTVAGADSTYMEESNEFDRQTYNRNEGLSQATAEDKYNDVSVSCVNSYLRTTLVIAAKATEFANNGIMVNLWGQNDFNLQFYGVGGTDPGFRVYSDASSTSGAVTADANDVVVLIAQYNAAETRFDVYCNNTFVGSHAIDPTGLDVAGSYKINEIDFQDTDTAARLIGIAVVPGLMSSGERQTFCDYFQQDAGVLPEAASLLLYDTFDETVFTTMADHAANDDNTSGGAWDVSAGLTTDFCIYDSFDNLFVDTTAGQNEFCRAINADVPYCVKAWLGPSSSGFFYLSLRIEDEDNYLRVLIDNGSGVDDIRLAEFVGGSGALLTQVSTGVTSFTSVWFSDDGERVRIGFDDGPALIEHETTRHDGSANFGVTGSSFSISFSYETMLAYANTIDPAALVVPV